MRHADETPNVISVRGARVNNLKNISVQIPRDKFVVITGVSGSGKSSLAFDTLYAEGQRRYVESLSSYARQFMGRMRKPDCDFINGLPPAIAIEQKVIARNPRSTVGTSTEIYDYLKLLFARIGKTYSPISGQEVKKHTAEDVVDAMLRLPRGTKLLLLAPLTPTAGRTEREQLEAEIQQGYSRLYINGEIISIAEYLKGNEELKIQNSKLCPAADPEGNEELKNQNSKLSTHNAQSSKLNAQSSTLKAQRSKLNAPPSACPSPSPLGEGRGEVLGEGRGEVFLLIDRLKADDCRETISRLTDSAETAFYEGGGACRLVILPAQGNEGNEELKIQNSKFSTLNAQSSTLKASPSPLGEGRGEVGEGRGEVDFSNRFEADGMTFEEPSEGLFSFNSPLGVCPSCEGYGKIIGIDESLVIPDPSLSVYDGCVKCWHGEKMGEWLKYFIRRAEIDNFPIFTPYAELSQEHKDWLWHGLPCDRGRDKYEVASIDNFFRMVKENQYKIQYRVMLSRYRGKTTCPECQGTRLRKEASYVRVAGKTITELVSMPISQLAEWTASLAKEKSDTISIDKNPVAARPLKEIQSRLQYLLDVGLGYLTLNRPSNTLSGGESQRINLTTSLGSSLVGSLYILDEPSIGMHSRDTERLIRVLKKLRDIGNTVIVVEHDEDIIRSADHIIEIGPAAGVHGGTIVYQGPPEGKEENEELKIQNSKFSPLPPQPSTNTEAGDVGVLARVKQGSTSLNSQFSARPKGTLSQSKATERILNSQFISLSGATLNNLKGVTVTIPLHCLCVVTGVSGSGKSSLIRGTLYPILCRHLGQTAETPGPYSAISGNLKEIRHVEMIDQNSISRSTRSNPATYIKAYDLIRQLMSEQQLAKQLGITAQHFSFNAEGGRCEECKGAGEVTIEMQFMADLTLQCPVCHGQRFQRNVLDVQYKGKNINDILALTIDEAIDFFSSPEGNEELKIQNSKFSTLKAQSSTLKASPSPLGEGRGEVSLLRAIVSRLEALRQVGLGYITLGQNSSTLSGGENQRLKLAYYIAMEHQEHTLFIFDEPTTGLHTRDIAVLMRAFRRLIDLGHSVLIIEHNLHVIRAADHIIDLGPEGGEGGGHIVATGTPQDIKNCPDSITGRYL